MHAARHLYAKSLLAPPEPIWLTPQEEEYRLPRKLPQDPQHERGGQLPRRSKSTSCNSPYYYWFCALKLFTNNRSIAILPGRRASYSPRHHFAPPRNQLSSRT